MSLHNGNTDPAGTCQSGIRVKSRDRSKAGMTKAFNAEKKRVLQDCDDESNGAGFHWTPKKVRRYMACFDTDLTSN